MCGNWANRHERVADWPAPMANHALIVAPDESCELNRSMQHFVEAMTFQFGRELFCHKHPSAPTIPNIIDSGKAWLGTLPKFPLPNPSA